MNRLSKILKSGFIYEISITKNKILLFIDFLENIEVIKRRGEYSDNCEDILKQFYNE